MLLRLKEDKPDGSTARDPYVCFRRRMERMQTRKVCDSSAGCLTAKISPQNRKNDETSYMHLLKLRRDLDRVRTIIDLVNRREKIKRDTLAAEAEVLENRLGASQQFVIRTAHC